MKSNAHKIAAVFYVLWGIIHVLGGFMMLSAANDGVNSFVKAQTGLNHAVILDTSANQNTLGVISAKGVFLFHSYNLIWIGIIVAVIAIRMNWKNSLPGYWLNLGLVGFTDIGLIIFIIVPGIMSISDAWIGPFLFVVAFFFSSAGLYMNRSNE